MKSLVLTLAVLFCGISALSATADKPEAAKTDAQVDGQVLAVESVEEVPAEEAKK